ncbi:MAG: hypothetical protein ACO3A4_12415 [Silvanigrellaceae bacterium]
MQSLGRRVLPCLKSFLFLLLTLAVSHFRPDAAWATPGDTTLTQRAGFVMSKGDLSRDPNHLGLMLTWTRAFAGPIKFLNMELMHRVSVLYDSFYALGEDSLLFPLLPHAQTRIVEPSIQFELCLFSQYRLRPCLGTGVSLVYLQSSIQNYQMYASAPAEARLLYANAERTFFFEAGARYRSFQNRIEGYVAKHADLMSFVGIGLFFPGDGL